MPVTIGLLGFVMLFVGELCFLLALDRKSKWWPVGLFICLLGFTIIVIYAKSI